MSKSESIYVRLDFHPDSSNQQRDTDFAYLFEKLDETIDETSAFQSYRVLTDPTSILSPSYDVWIAEPPSHTLARALGGLADHCEPWEWLLDQRFTCEDDPDGKGARQSAHEYARYLRKTYPCAYVAVRPAGKAPLPVRPPLEDEPPFKDFSASWLGL